MGLIWARATRIAPSIGGRRGGVNPAAPATVRGMPLREPVSRSYASQGLRLHYTDWGNASAPPLVLVHGGRDHGRSWDALARVLADRWHVIAPDLRGHGDSNAAPGSRYSTPDFVLDLAALVDELGAASVTLIGHSLGGAIVLHYAGAFPERVAKVVALEGLGPAPELRERLLAISGPERLRSWVGEMQRLAAKPPRRFASVDEAVARMREANAHLTPALARHLTEHGLRREPDGAYVWKFDPRVRASSPVRPDFDSLPEIWHAIRGPVLLMRGEESWASDPEKDGRIRHFRAARLVNVPNAGHWLHHDRPALFEREIVAFLEEPLGPAPPLRGAS